MFKKLMITSYILMPCLAQCADQPTSVLFRFNDEPGEYLIKLELVKDLVLNERKTQVQHYTPLKIRTHKYEQSPIEDFLTSVIIPADATHLKICIRKEADGEFKQGGLFFIDADELRNGAKKYGSKNSNYGIILMNPFVYFSQQKSPQYKLEQDSLLINSKY